MLKFTLLGALVGLMATWIGDAATSVILFGSAGMTIAIGWRKVIAPLVRLADLLGGMPEWMERIEERLEAVETPAAVAAEKATAVARELDVQSRSEPRTDE